MIILAGPTATGKTRLSLELAARIPGLEIISADARQVYRGMEIGTAKVGQADRVRVPHHGLDLVDPDQPFSVADYARHVAGVLDEIADRRGAALLVGGTGLYLRAIGQALPLSSLSVDPRRAELEQRLIREGRAALAAELERVAPTVAAHTDLANPRRVVRALERAYSLGDRLPAPGPGYAGPILWLGVELERVAHLRAIAERVEHQFSSGLLEEAAMLRARYGPDLRAFSAISYQEAFAQLDGRLTVDEAIEQTIRRTRQYVRRQRTWFRSEPAIEWFHLDDGGEPLRIAEQVRRFLDRARSDDGHGSGRGSVS